MALDSLGGAHGLASRASVGMVQVAWALASSGCLVLEPPQFDEVVTTPPLLLGANATPDLKTIPRVELAAQQKLQFNAEVLSEDGAQRVALVMLLDYGTEGPAGTPFVDNVGEPRTLEPSTLAAGPRTTGLFDFFPRSHPIGPGCHSLTLFASHELDGFCPANLVSDSSQLTWIVEVCAEGGVCPTSCTPGEPGCVPFSCPTPTVSCAAEAP